MATVIGKTSNRIEEITGPSLVDVRISPDRHLFTETRSGLINDLGPLIRPEDISNSDLSAELDQLQVDLYNLNVELDTLNNTTLPQLQVDLSNANAELSELENTTLPQLNTRLGEAEAEVTTLNFTTIPNLNAALTDAQTAIDTLTGETIPDINTTLNSNQTAINTLNNTTIPDLNTQISTLNTTTIPGLNDRLSEAEGEISDALAGVSALQGKFPIIGTDITDGAISTPKMTANSINGDRVTANTLNAAKIIAGTITTDRMTANTIAGDRITANTLNADKIIAGTITTNLMSANTINGDRITANTLNADKIIANTITGDKIKANTISVANLLVGSMDNLIQDPTFQADIGVGWSSTSGLSIAPTASRSGGRALQFVNSAAQQTTYNTPQNIPCEAGDVFNLSLWYEQVGADLPASGLMFGARFTLANGTTTFSSFYSPATAVDTWTRLQGKAAAPANTVYVSFYVVSQTANSAGTLIVDYVSVVRAANGELIVDGSILTNHMTSNTINGDRITANTLNAAKIIAGTITTDRMTANTIDGDRVTANTLEAGKIVAGSITTDRMTANTISGDRVTANTMNAAKIVAGSISTDRMTSNTINGDRISTNTLHGDKIIANTITASRLNVIPGGENLIVNSSFDNATSYLASWSKYDNSGVATTSVAAGRRGGQAVRLSWSAAASIVGLMQSFPGGWVGGQQYVFSVYAKASGGAVGGTLAMASNAPAISYTWVENPPLTTGWQRYIALCSRASATTDALFFGIVGGYGTAGVAKTVDFDDVQMEEGELVTAYSPMTDEILPGTINAAMIKADAIDGMTITGATIRTAPSGARITFDSTGLKAYNASAQTFNLSAADGSVLVGPLTGTFPAQVKLGTFTNLVTGLGQGCIQLISGGTGWGSSDIQAYIVPNSGNGTMSTMFNSPYPNAVNGYAALQKSSRLTLSCDFQGYSEASLFSNSNTTMYSNSSFVEVKPTTVFAYATVKTSVQGDSEVYINTNSSGTGVTYLTAGSAWLRYQNVGNYPYLFRHGATAGIQFMENRVRIVNPGANAFQNIEANAFVVSSDQRSKLNPKRVPSGAMDRINKVIAYDYTIKNGDGKTQRGLMAQEVQKVLPHAVSEDENGKLALSLYDLLTEAYVAIQELSDKVDSLESAVL